MKTFSLDKTIKQISVLSCESFTYGEQIFLPPKQLKLSSTFWRKYGCYLNCGGCCLSFSLDYLPDEADSLISDNLKAGLKERLIEINGIQRPILSYPPEGLKWCKFLDKQTGECTVHADNPLSCRIELIKFKRIKDRGYIGKQAYGRAWAMKTIHNEDILCDFADFDETQFWDNDIQVLIQLQRWAHYFEIKTNIAKVINALEVCVGQKKLRTFTIYNG